MRLIIFSCFLLSVFFSCKKDGPAFNPQIIGQHVDTVKPPVDTSGAPPSLVFVFNAFANNTPLVVNTKFYSNSSLDQINVTKFNYYISNIKITREDGFVFIEPESYHLIQHVEGQISFTVNNLPAGNYKRIDFLIGVDSLRNVSGAQSGALDVANNMFWDWNTGYIFFKLEGDFVSNKVPGGAQYAIHVGGFEGENNCIQKAGHDLSQMIIAKKGRQSKITYKVSLDEIFDNPQKIGLDDYYDAISTGPRIFKTISENYMDMFAVDKVEN